MGAPAEHDLRATHAAKLVADRRALGAAGHAEFDENVLGVRILVDVIYNDANGLRSVICQPPNVGPSAIAGLIKSGPQPALDSTRRYNSDFVIRALAGFRQNPRLVCTTWSLSHYSIFRKPGPVTRRRYCR